MRVSLRRITLDSSKAQQKQQEDPTNVWPSDKSSTVFKTFGLVIFDCIIEPTLSGDLPGCNMGLLCWLLLEELVRVYTFSRLTLD